MLRVGYQGMENSNSEEAAKKMMTKLKVSNYELVPLISSKNVISALKRKEIDYGVVAVKNSIGGIVKETLEAIKNETLEHVCTEIMAINHSVFIINPNITRNEILKVISHEQALKQCNNNIRNFFPHSINAPIEDTAIGAQYLAEGKYDEYTAVICNKSAGLKYNLHLIEEQFQDTSDNRTEFRMFKTYDINPNDHTPSKFDQISYSIINEKGIGNLTKAIIVLTIFGSFYLKDLFNWSTLDASMTIGAMLAALILFLTSNKLRANLQNRKLIGYWKYYAIPDNLETNIEQRFETPRVVEINEIDGKLNLIGWLCDNETVPLFTSSTVMTSNFGKRNGKLVYWYNTPNQSAREFNLNGIVTLNWDSIHPASKVDSMSGWYMGKTTKDIGSLKYLRITKNEYLALQNSDYL
ncbi:MAG: prephenate dehydratase domain-containing protein [Paenisporosarcina sp.]